MAEGKRHSGLEDAMVETETWKGREAVVLRSETLEAVVLPELGGKIASLVHLPTGTELLLQPNGSRPPRSGRETEPDYTDADGWGFDECFPTIAPSPPFPDHGELWSRAWDAEHRGETLRLSINGVHMRYGFERAARLEGDRLVLDYAVRNRSARPLPCLWSAHPLFNVAPDSCIVLPEHVKRLLVVSSSDPELGRGREIAWPEPGLGSLTELARVPPADAGVVVKAVTDRLDRIDGHKRRGRAPVRAQLQRPDAGLSVALEFNASEIPYLGLWLCYGATPDGWEHAPYTIALEPTTGRGDNLTLAAARGHCELLTPGAAQRWSLSVTVREMET